MIDLILKKFVWWLFVSIVAVTSLILAVAIQSAFFILCGILEVWIALPELFKLANQMLKKKETS